VQAEQARADSEQASDSKTTKTPSKQTFIFKDEIKELMLLLFSLCEYNFKLIFSKANTGASGASLVGLATGDATTATESPDRAPLAIPAPSETISSFEETPTTRTRVERRESYTESIEELLEKHISKDSKEFSRCKSLINFFLSNKSLINSFIRVNQQVVNTELKNLAMRIPLILEFDTKRLIWKQELKKY